LRSQAGGESNAFGSRYEEWPSSINFDFRLITRIYSSPKKDGNFFVIFLFLIMRRIIMGAREWVDM
jgi:hypothetical protein